MHALNRVRPADDAQSGLTQMEADALEDALLESRAFQQAGWLDLFRPKYVRRTIVSPAIIFAYPAGLRF